MRPGLFLNSPREDLEVLLLTEKKERGRISATTHPQIFEEKERLVHVCKDLILPTVKGRKMKVFGDGNEGAPSVAAAAATAAAAAGAAAEVENRQGPRKKEEEEESN